KSDSPIRYLRTLMPTSLSFHSLSNQLNPKNFKFHLFAPYFTHLPFDIARINMHFSRLAILGLGLAATALALPSDKAQVERANLGSHAQCSTGRLSNALRLTCGSCSCPTRLRCWDLS